MKALVSVAEPMYHASKASNVRRFDARWVNSRGWFQSVFRATEDER